VIMGIDLISYQDEIASHIETAFPQYEIIEDEVLDGESIARLKKKTKPFIVLRWSGLTRNVSNASFAGVRRDEYISDFDIIAVAPQPKMARVVLNYFMDGLIGHKLSNGYPLTPLIGQAVFPAAENQASPKLYLAIGTLEFRFSAENPEPNMGS
jgi:hypothetical protein